MFATIADEVQAAVAKVWGTAASREVQGQGAGGDGTVYIDSLAEQIVLRALEQEHRRGRSFHLVSEEVGERTYGEGGDTIIVDPIDGSHNAKMGIPYFSVALAAARGRTFGAVYEGSVRNLVTGEHFEARRGGGARRNGALMHAGTGLSDGRINVLQLEATAWDKNSWRFDRLVADAQKLRVLGSAALNICLCATGALTLSVAPSLRSVDCVAPLLILEEAGGAATDLEGGSLAEAGLELSTRIPVMAGASPQALRRGLDLVRATEPANSREAPVA
ncbi:MAG: inositol monophosphatase family protein [Candidatus Dormibacteria bacterium]